MVTLYGKAALTYTSHQAWGGHVDSATEALAQFCILVTPIGHAATVMTKVRLLYRVDKRRERCFSTRGQRIRRVKVGLALSRTVKICSLHTFYFLKHSIDHVSTGFNDILDDALAKHTGIGGVDVNINSKKIRLV